jgi:hypothetical protein
MVTANFNEPVTGVEVADFSLMRNGTAVDLTGATVTQVTDTQYTLHLSSVIGAAGLYVLTLRAGGSTIQDTAGNHLAGDAADAFTVHPWQNVRDVYDVNDDANVTPIDVLLVINHININGSGPILSPAAEPPFVDVNGDDSSSPIDVLLVINYINSHPLVPGEGEAVADAASSPVLSGLPAFNVPTTALLPIAPLQEAGIAPNDAHPWSATWPPAVPMQPANSDLQSASLGTTRNERDSLLNRATRTLTPDDVERTRAALEDILPDIAEDVFHGWEQSVGTV